MAISRISLRQLLSIFAIGMFCLGIQTAQAAPGNGAQLTTIDGPTLKSILMTEGYSALTVDEDGDIVGKLDGIPFLVIVSSDKSSLLFKYGASGTDANLHGVNEWNKSKKYSRAYIDGDGDPVLESDLDLTGGVTVARVKDFFKTAITSMKAFRIEVCGKQ